MLICHQFRCSNFESRRSFYVINTILVADSFEVISWEKSRVNANYSYFAWMQRRKFNRRELHKYDSSWWNYRIDERNCIQPLNGGEEHIILFHCCCTFCVLYSQLLFILIYELFLLLHTWCTLLRCIVGTNFFMLVNHVFTSIIQTIYNFPS